MDKKDIKNFERMLNRDGYIYRRILDFLPGDFPCDAKFEERLKNRIREYVTNYMEQCIIGKMY